MSHLTLAANPTAGFDLHYRPASYWLGAVSDGGAWRDAGCPQEVVIARLSISGDISGEAICLSARRIGQDRIRYALVDDAPECELRYSYSPQESEKPLTFGQLVSLLEGAVCESSAEEYRSVIRGMLRFNVECGVENIAGAKVKIESVQYPQLEAYFDDRIRSWLAETSQP